MTGWAPLEDSTVIWMRSSTQPTREIGRSKSVVEGTHCPLLAQLAALASSVVAPDSLVADDSLTLSGSLLAPGSLVGVGSGEC
jgi:hypothetical protein